ncbi:FAD-dependent oxidoreductase [Corynebacterium sp. TAE3-ERU12]|uniref:FAD-dependent oxidoreductase n=1 Tax=Corynebacterium sp. TAE3-ERU12 TaxID=2849491 RepID=UPI001C48B48E|nr:FAD-dependent oxidoreductase [Corynebacterium sp. TAE3-ERU12]MBV7295979.1 FAD-dependent oxidoreductase [Corynebacterium sp. TAE3-ERU12]
MPRPLRVAVIGSGPAGVYASDALMKSGREVSVDLFEKMPAPFGLIRYGVAPDHPRIKGIIKSLHRVLDKPEVRLLSNVEFGADLTLDDLRKHYDAAIIATGAVGDRDLKVPGSDLEGNFGAGEFVGFYDGNPLFPRTWDVSAEKVAVVGVGNVGLDIARVLAKTADELKVTEIPDNVYETLKDNKATEVHIFGRRGPAQAKFTPLELKELDHSPTIQVVVNPNDIDYDEGSTLLRRESKMTEQVCSILEKYAIREVEDRPHKLFIHFLESPVEVLGEDGRVRALRTERMRLDGNGGIEGTGEFTDWECGAVYRAVGYRSDSLPEVPFDTEEHVIPNEAGRVLDDGEHIKGLYTTGWIKRGPVGLIGNTKGDANETVDCLLADVDADFANQPDAPGEDDILATLDERGVRYLTWNDWYTLDAHERALGEAEERERKKVVEWDEMVARSLGE